MTADEFYNRFEFDLSESILGRGGFSSVHKVYDNVRKRYVAIKRSEVGAFQKFDLEREVKLANEIDIHPNIVRYENVYRISDRSGINDYAIMKYYADGNLDDILSRYSLNERDINQILSGILNGLAHLHQIPIIHRDFKTSNILMDRNEAGNWIPKIADFGLSRLIHADVSFALNNSQIAHTPSYVAPEQLLDNGAIRPNTDLWAFGVVTYKIMLGKLPFRVEGNKGDWDTTNKLRGLILEGKLPSDISTIKEPYKSIIQLCLVTNPEKRVKKAEDLLKLMIPNPVISSSSLTQITSSDNITQKYKLPQASPVPLILEKEEKPVNGTRFKRETVIPVASIFIVIFVFYWSWRFSQATRTLPAPVLPDKKTVKESASVALPKATGTTIAESVKGGFAFIKEGDKYYYWEPDKSKKVLIQYDDENDKLENLAYRYTFDGKKYSIYLVRLERILKNIEKSTLDKDKIEYTSNGFEHTIDPRTGNEIRSILDMKKKRKQQSADSI